MNNMKENRYKNYSNKSGYHYLIAIAGILMVFCCGGLLITGFTTYFPYLIDLRGFTNTQVSVLVFIRTLTSTLALLFVDRMIERFGIRRLVSGGLLLGAAALGIFAVAGNYFTFCLAGCLSGIAYGSATVVPATIMITRWFHTNTGFVLGICLAASGMGAFIGGPMVTLMVESWSLSASFMAEAALFVLCAVYVFAVVRDDPSAAGLEPFGKSTVQTSAKAKAEDDGGEKYAPRTASRVLIVIIMTGWLLYGAPANSLHFNLSVLYQSVGFTSGEIATIVSILGISLAIGKCVCGIMSDKLGVFKTVMFFFILIMIGNVIFCLARITPFPVACSASFLAGFGLSVTTVGTAPYAMRISSRKDYPRIVSRFQFMLTLGGLIFSLLPGILADMTGDYILAYVIMLVLCVISSILVQGAYIKATN